MALALVGLNIIIRFCAEAVILVPRTGLDPNLGDLKGLSQSLLWTKKVLNSQYAILKGARVTRGQSCA